jgi:tRNA pseudouridine38-40 synthase
VTVIRLVLAYDGTEFHGWARQTGVRTVQGVIEEALGRLLGEPPSLAVAGRTDAGVHAWGQVASFDAPEGLDPERVQRAVNGMLAPEVVVRRANRVPDGFDARRSAIARAYVYRIDTGAVPNPFEARFVWHRPGVLSVRWMRRAARDLMGEHDFASFCRVPKASTSTVRRLRRLSVSQPLGSREFEREARPHRIEIRAEADAFLHQMVRSLVGTLVAVGSGKLPPESMPSVLAAGSRAAAGPVAPANGLTLVRVSYGRPARAGGSPYETADEH